MPQHVAVEHVGRARIERVAEPDQQPQRPARRGIDGVLPAVEAAEHEGAALVEIYQNCPVFNDGAFAPLTDKGVAVFNRIPLEQGRPIRFGPDGERGVARRPDGGLEIVDADDADLVVHDARLDDPTQAFALARLAASPSDPTPIGVFRAVERPVGGREAGRRVAAARAELAPDALDALLHAGDTWTVA